METPTPVDLSKLKSILGNAKKIMMATEQKFASKKPQNLRENYSDEMEYDSPVYQSPVYDERDEKEMNYRQPEVAPNNGLRVSDYTEEQVRNSNFPQAVKEAMLKNPIKKTSMAATFNLEGLEDLIEKPKVKTPVAPIRESYSNTSNNQMMSMSKSELNEIIDNRVNQVLAAMFTKALAEQTIKKTIGTLIKEGKIKQ